MSGMGPIPCMAIISLCGLYGGTLEDFEKVLLLDTQHSAASEAKRERKEKENPPPAERGIKKMVKIKVPKGKVKR